MDIELAVDAMELAGYIDHMVLFSGDGDFPGSPADFGKLIADETEKWAKVIQFPLAGRGAS